MGGVLRSARRRQGVPQCRGFAPGVPAALGQRGGEVARQGWRPEAAGGFPAGAAQGPVQQRDRLALCRTAERLKVAESCCTRLEMTMPLLVDTLDDRVGHAYSGMPDRLYVIDTRGRVVYKAGRGPFGFKAGEMEQSLLMLQLDAALAKPPV